MVVGVVVGVERCSSLYRLLGGRIRLDGSLASGGASPSGPSGGQGVRGACRGGGMVAGEHLPDRFGEAAGEVDLGDFGAALFAEPLFGVLVAVAVERVAAGVHGCFDQRPAQVAGPVLASAP